MHGVHLSPLTSLVKRLLLSRLLVEKPSFQIFKISSSRLSPHASCVRASVLLSVSFTKPTDLKKHNSCFEVCDARGCCVVGVCKIRTPPYWGPKDQKEFPGSLITCSQNSRPQSEHSTAAQHTQPPRFQPQLQPHLKPKYL